MICRPDFYSFAQPAAQPQFPLDLVFSGPDGAQIKLLGYERTAGLPVAQHGLSPLLAGADALAGLNLRAFVITPDGREVDSSDERLFIQPLWLPPDRWQPGETVVTAKLAWYLPKEWALAALASTRAIAGRCRQPLAGQRERTRRAACFDFNTWTPLGAWQWQHNSLQPLDPPAFSVLPDHTFGGDGWLVQLSGVNEQRRAGARQSGARNAALAVARPFAARL